MRNYKISLFLLLIVCLLAPATMQQVQAQTKKITLLQTSDVHSRIEPINQADDRNNDMGGFVRRATLIKELRQTNPDLLLLDCGDISQGTPYYNMFKGELEVKLMNEMNYDVMAIGNHEFDFGLDNMARIFKMAKFPIVCANYNVEATVLKGLVKPYVILIRNDVKIGIFGLGVELEGMVQANKCEGVTYQDPITVANEVAKTLKEKEGCDLVVCLSHLGVQMDERLIPNTRNIDVVLGGHSHTFMKAPKNYLNLDGLNVSLLHTGKSGIYVGRIDLTLGKK